MNSDIERKKVLITIEKNVNNLEWDCMIDNCKKNSINSHLLQQNGILHNVADDGHLYEMKIKDVYKLNHKSPPYDFFKIGIKSAISFPLYCQAHDTSIFNYIEKHPIDIYSYKCHLLFSYRALCSEIRKKQMNTELYRRHLGSKILERTGSNLKNISMMLDANLKGIKDLSVYKKLFENDIEANTENFTFEIYEYPLIKVYCSATFTPIADPKLAFEEKPLDAVFINIIPIYNKTLVIVGYHNNFVDDWIKKYVSSWNDLTDKEFTQKLSTLFTTRIETWGMSPGVYKKIDKNLINKYLNYWDENTYNFRPDQNIHFNLFENI